MRHSKWSPAQTCHVTPYLCPHVRKNSTLSVDFRVLRLMASEVRYLQTFDWSRWHIFWADERVVPLSHADSNYKAAVDEFLSKVGQGWHMYVVRKVLEGSGRLDLWSMGFWEEGRKGGREEGRKGGRKVRLVTAPQSDADASHFPRTHPLNLNPKSPPDPGTHPSLPGVHPLGGQECFPVR